MIITICEWYHNGEQVSLKLCLLKKKNNTIVLIYLNQVNTSAVVLKDDGHMQKKSSHNIGSIPLEKHKKTLFGNPMMDEFHQSVQSNDMHEDLAFKLEGSSQVSRCQARHERYMQFRWTRKKNLLEKELTISKIYPPSRKIQESINTSSSMTKDTFQKDDPSQERRWGKHVPPCLILKILMILRML